MNQLKATNLKLFIGLLLLLSSLVSAKTVRLITIGPGDAFWSAFGHTAIAIDNDVYGFGYFSFNEEIISEFINNQMNYELGLSELNHELWLAQQQNRDFSVAELELSAAEIIQIETYLKWHNLPENQAYRYDYFLNNCSTKIRDILDNVWQGQLLTSTSDMTQSNYIEQTFPAKHQGLMNFGLAIAYGWPAYESKSVWDLMAFPVYFESMLKDRLSNKIKSNNTLFEAELTATLMSLLLTHWAVVLYSLVWLVLLGLTGFKQKITKAWFVWHGIIGLLLLCLWLLTPHQVASNNFNVLLFSPLGLLVFKPRLMKSTLVVCYSLWFLLAMYLNAWYLMVMLLPGLVALKNLSLIIGTDKPRLTFGGVG